MSQQRYSHHDVAKEPHSISLKVLRLSRPSLVAQYPVQRPWSSASASACACPASIPASLAYVSNSTANPDPFIISPILKLPTSFGSAYVGETFSCTLCASHDVAESIIRRNVQNALAPVAKKAIRDVRIEAEMKTPASPAASRLDLGSGADGNALEGVDLEPGDTLQKMVRFELKGEGNHVLAVTVSYYEATETSGRTRTFRKLYHFVCKPSLVVRTKARGLPKQGSQRRWVLEAQLENCTEAVMQLERVGLDLEGPLQYSGCNWEASKSPRPLLHPGEVEQVCFVVDETDQRATQEDGRAVLGVLSVGWRGEMGKRGYLSTGRLSALPLSASG